MLASYKTATPEMVWRVEDIMYSNKETIVYFPLHRALEHGVVQPSAQRLITIFTRLLPQARGCTNAHILVLDHSLLLYNVCFSGAVVRNGNPGEHLQLRTVI